MENLRKVLEAIEALYAGMKVLEEKLSKQIAEYESKLKELINRESKIADIESADAVYENAKKLMTEVDANRIALDEQKAKFENDVRDKQKEQAKESARIKKELEKLSELQADKIKLAADRKALDEEKTRYKEQISKELMDHFKNTSSKK